MAKMKNKLGAKVTAEAPRELQSHKSGERQFVSLSKQNTGKPATGVVHSIGKEEIAKELAADSPYDISAEIRDGKLHLIMDEKEKLETDDARRIATVAAERHLNLHQVMRQILGSIPAT